MPVDAEGRITSSCSIVAIVSHVAVALVGPARSEEEGKEEGERDTGGEDGADVGMEDGDDVG